MARKQWLGYTALLAVVAGGLAGCESKPPAPPPPGVTKEMEKTAPPVIDLGPPKSTSAPGEKK